MSINQDEDSVCANLYEAHQNPDAASADAK